ncbi:MAG: RHS repeat domain-containing protein, partial [Synechococcaceae cyanobacterium]
RVQKDTAAGTTKFIWDDQNYLAEADGSNVVTTVYTNEPERYGRLVSSVRGNARYFNSFDAIGNTRAIGSSDATTIGVVVFDAWGNVKSDLLFTSALQLWCGEYGYIADTETRHHYVRRRVSNPATSRWTSMDPLFSLATMSQPFALVLNNPIMRLDPAGLLSYVNAKSRANFGGMDCQLEENVTMHVGNCGKFVWAVRWTGLPEKANGVIIQQVTRRKKIELCEHVGPKAKLMPNRVSVCENQKPCNEAGDGSISYLELWRVIDGKVFTTGALREPQPGGYGQLPADDNQDIFAFLGYKSECTGSCTKGSYHVAGVAFFVPFTDIEDERAFLEFAKTKFGVGKDGVMDACMLYSACSTPELEGWIVNLKSRHGISGEDTVSRSAESSWNCCCINWRKGQSPCNCCASNVFVFEAATNKAKYDLSNGSDFRCNCKR